MKRIRKAGSSAWSPSPFFGLLLISGCFSGLRDSPPEASAVGTTQTPALMVGIDTPVPSCPIDSENCMCTPGGTCDSLYTCLNDTCKCATGSLGCPCTSGNECDGVLICDNDQCTALAQDDNLDPNIDVNSNDDSGDTDGMDDSQPLEVDSTEPQNNEQTDTTASDQPTDPSKLHKAKLIH